MGEGGVGTGEGREEEGLERGKGPERWARREWDREQGREGERA